MVKSKVLKQLRKKIAKADRVENPLLAAIRNDDDLQDDNNKLSLEFHVKPTKDNAVSDGDAAADDDHHDNNNNNHNNSKATTTLLSIEYCSSADLDDDCLQCCLSLFESNMGEFYRQSSWGLDLQAKAEEFRHDKARFLLIWNSTVDNENNTRQLVAFVHFRFCYDDDDEPTCAVLYVYELQVHAAFQRLGLGRRLMLLIEAMARGCELPKVMLTVFQTNTQAMQFYRKTLQYQIDETSPSQHGEEADYEILCKPIV